MELGTHRLFLIPLLSLFLMKDRAGIGKKPCMHCLPNTPLSLLLNLRQTAVAATTRIRHTFALLVLLELALAQPYRVSYVISYEHTVWLPYRMIPVFNRVSAKTGKTSSSISSPKISRVPSFIQSPYLRERKKEKTKLKKLKGDFDFGLKCLL